MAKVAKDIVLKNGYKDTITVVPKRSTEMTVGPGTSRVCTGGVCNNMHYVHCMDVSILHVCSVYPNTLNVQLYLVYTTFIYQKTPFIQHSFVTFTEL